MSKHGWYVMDLELLLFLKLIKQTGIEVFDSYGRQILNNPETKIRGILDADYREQVSLNVANTKASNAAKDIAPASGNRPYGYTKNYGALVSEEVVVLKEAARRLLVGETLYAICESFNKRGIYKYCRCDKCRVKPLKAHMHMGARWESSHLSKFLARAEYAGIRTYKGEEIAKGAWPILWDKNRIKAEVYYHKLREKLGQKQPWSDTTARKYLLVGILVCDLCGTKLTSKSSPRQYWCGKGCRKVSRNMQHLDDYMLRRGL